MDSKKKTNLLKKETYVLYLLNNLSSKTDKYRVNKIAFLTEFAYIYKNNIPLSEIQYAAIDKGPVIDEYKSLFKKMEKAGKIKVDRIYVRPLKDADMRGVSPAMIKQLDELIEKFSKFDTNSLIALTHALDSYIITTKNEKVMGNIIDKSLANLDIYFDENLDKYQENQIPQNQLPELNREDLVEYDSN